MGYQVNIKGPVEDHENDVGYLLNELDAKTNGFEHPILYHILSNVIS